MRPLDPTARIHLKAAIGWLGLGRHNYREAKVELFKMHHRYRNHPQFLNLWWHINSRAQDYHACLAIARQRIQFDPSDGDTWSDHAYTLNRLGRTRAALTALLPVAGRFPDSDLICHNLACFLCLLGQVDEARTWLWRAFAVATRNGNARHRFESALNDPELAALQPELQKVAARISQTGPHPSLS